MPTLWCHPKLLLATAEQGYLAYLPSTNRLHRLNSTAALIVELANGERNRTQLLELVTPLLPAEQFGGAEWLDHALEAGILIESSEPQPPANRTAEQLRHQAASLRRRDQVLAAYVCQQCAVDLAPDEPKLQLKLGELAHIVGQRLVARAAYERYFATRPDDAEAALILTALHDDTPPPRASDACITQLYGYFADYYDRNMRGELRYRGPELLRSALSQSLDSPAGLRILDLGCGTGLMGQAVKPWAARLVGVDLSPAMLTRAAERNVYDELIEAELTVWLAREPRETFDVIAICDTLIYFGDLRQVLPKLKRHLAPGGLVGFTVERGEQEPFKLTDSGRFSHHQAHLQAVAAEAGFQTLSQKARIMRQEYGESVIGWVTVVRGGTMNDEVGMQNAEQVSRDARAERDIV